MVRERILIVEDNPSNVRLLSFLLGFEGYSVQTASTAVEALAAVQSEPPALILMDLQLPGMSGLDATRRLKANPATAGIIVVAVTAYAMKGDEEQALGAGCDGYVSKPIDTRTFPSTIRRMLDVRASRSRLDAG